MQNSIKYSRKNIRNLASFNWQMVWVGSGVDVGDSVGGSAWGCLWVLTDCVTPVYEIQKSKFGDECYQLH